MKLKKITSIVALTLGVAGYSLADTNLRWGMQASVSSLEYKAAELAAKQVEETTDGRVTISLFPEGQLGDDRDMLAQVTWGTLDVTYAQMGRIGDWIPRAGVTQLPYVIRDYDHIKSIYNSDFGQDLRDEMTEEYNWHPMAVSYFGTRHTTSNRPIESIEDMDGLKLRVPNARVLLDFAKYSGASPAPIAFSEVYLALQTNAVDGQENPLPTINAQKFYEVQDYLALTGHMAQDIITIVSEKTYQGLSGQDRDALEEALQAGADFMAQEVIEGERELVDFFKSEGLTVTRPDQQPFRDAMQPMYDEFEKELGESLVADIQAL
ncbi:sialic acid TRAP transporter substrate-binding protein SiaP [Saccharospirillum salsuginis]|uniref:Sialic acid-binding periplasmic protein SiaP n=1 Tax=Saccharospirillum salsuginis TaxID=418750 RepID=A0A918N707_9GAMM|nr:sialic acid TRAP transporter substrate-binding protein SiaP [Saccharospirillum salsuginis]GGX41793.1 sialic acid-binding periplasmic protein SiaP [Saccharospirillum salsuginis]